MPPKYNKNYNVGLSENVPIGTSRPVPTVNMLKFEKNFEKNNRALINSLRNGNPFLNKALLTAKMNSLNNGAKSVFGEHVQYVNGKDTNVIFFKTSLRAANISLFQRLGTKNENAQKFLQLLSGGFIFIKDGPFGTGMYANIFLRALVNFAKALAGKHVPIIDPNIPQPGPLPPNDPNGPVIPNVPKRKLKNPRDAIQSLESALQMIINAKTFILSLQNNNNLINESRNTNNQRSTIKDLLDAIRTEVNNKNMNSKLLVSRPLAIKKPTGL